jgi:hypothetical protein
MLSVKLEGINHLNRLYLRETTALMHISKAKAKESYIIEGKNEQRKNLNRIFIRTRLKKNNV